MKLADFTQTLYNRCGEGLNAPDFMLRLVDPLNDADAAKAERDEYNPLSKASPDHIGRVFSGTRPFGKKAASAVLTHLDKGKFVDYLDSLLTDDARNGLCYDLRFLSVHADAGNVAEICADRFEEILAACVNPAQKKTSAKKRKSDSGDCEFFDDYKSVDLVAYERLMSKIEYELLMETGGRCPFNCGKELSLESGADAIKHFAPTRIDGGLPAELDNLIALCPDCNKKHMLDLSDDKVERLRAIKTRIAQEYAASGDIEDVAVEPQIRKVLEKLTVFEVHTDGPDLNLKHVGPEKKIYPEFRLLLNEIKLKVNMYFDVVKEVFKNLEAERHPKGAPFTLIATEFRMAFLREQAKGYPQDVIFYALVDWLHKLTHVNKLASEIVVAFFVENCEVFDEIA